MSTTLLIMLSFKIVLGLEEEFREINFCGYLCHKIIAKPEQF